MLLHQVKVLAKLVESWEGWFERFKQQGHFGCKLIFKRRWFDYIHLTSKYKSQFTMQNHASSRVIEFCQIIHLESFFSPQMGFIMFWPINPHLRGNPETRCSWRPSCWRKPCRASLSHMFSWWILGWQKFLMSRWGDPDLGSGEFWSDMV